MLARSPSRGRYAIATRLEKLGGPEHERVERLVAKMERSVRRAFLAFVQNVQSPAIMRQVADLLGNNDTAGALRIVDRYVARTAPLLSSVFTTAATDEVKALAPKVKRIKPAVGLSFDPTHARAAELMRQAQLQFIRHFTESQREAVRQAVSSALISGEGPRGAAKAFRNAIGLTPHQEQAVRNYRRLLTQGSSEALERDLRDRRYDNTVRRAVTSGDPLSAKQIDAMVDKYRQRYVMYRADTIARTETADVVSAARQEALEQVAEDLDIADDMFERVWRSTKDARTRDSHRSMDGQIVSGTKAPFISGAGVPLMRPLDPAAPASERVGCRCIQIIRVKKRETRQVAAPVAIDYARLDAEARQAVLDRGRAANKEFLDGYDRRTGERIALLGGNAKSYVGFSDELVKQLEDPSYQMVLHHNHPRSSSLSGQDLLMLQKFPGMHSVVAHGHDGSMYAASEARNVTMDVINQTLQSVHSQIGDAVRAAEITIDDANAIVMHANNLALAKMGKIAYIYELQGQSRAAYDRNRQLVELLLMRFQAQ